MREIQLPYTLPGPLITERLVLRAMTAADVEDVHAYQSREDVCRYMTYEPRTREAVGEKVATYARALTLSEDGDFWQLALASAQCPERVIGDVYFAIRSRADATAEMGCVLHPDFAGRGYMTEAAGAVLDLAFGVLGLHRVLAEVDPSNTASVALCRRLGMRQEAHFVEDVWFKGAWCDTGVHAILDREWRAMGGEGIEPPTSSV